ncbi:hypothetical protein [Paraburkholderia sp. UCT2]|uniref:hypothetical protein n=1 Tax=Paraburkholderia sp. UCT2 TaxID=2615208 RepID=UPI001655DE09|nr:hypothetical protein [Paraburkholderia sp. UCT2]MBC8730470.1 hypothetical protein [Paraburkholderia sp. UCT2]
MHLDIEARPLHFPLTVVFIARRNLDAGLAPPPFGNVFFSPETLSIKPARINLKTRESKSDDTWKSCRLSV